MKSSFVATFIGLTVGYSIFALLVDHNWKEAFNDIFTSLIACLCCYINTRKFDTKINFSKLN